MLEVVFHLVPVFNSPSGQFLDFKRSRKVRENLLLTRERLFTLQKSCHQCSEHFLWWRKHNDCPHNDWTWKYFASIWYFCLPIEGQLGEGEGKGKEGFFEKLSACEIVLTAPGSTLQSWDWVTFASCKFLPMSMWVSFRLSGFLCFPRTCWW